MLYQVYNHSIDQINIESFFAKKVLVDLYSVGKTDSRFHVKKDRFRLFSNVDALQPNLYLRPNPDSRLNRKPDGQKYFDQKIKKVKIPYS